METKSENFLTANLIGMGQIMLQENKWTGLLFLIGIWYGSPMMGVAVTLSVVIGTATAWALKYDKGQIYSGLYGFNAALVGAGLNFYFGPGALIWVFIVGASALSTVLMHVFLRRGLPAYTFPFIALTWLSIYLLLHVCGVPYVVHPPLHEVYNDAVTMTSHGFGEVIFQGDVLVGLIFFVAIFINSPISALYGLVGAMVGASASHFINEPQVEIDFGLFSFNGVLCAIAFAGPKPRDGLFVLLASALAVGINALMVEWDVISLTFPFVLASWLTLLVRRLVPARPAGALPAATPNAV
jgi:urea transporter